MTIIAAAKSSDGSVFIGADKTCTAGTSYSIDTRPKIFWNKEFLIGVSGSLRFAQVAQYIFKPPDIQPDEDLHEYMVAKFCTEFRQIARLNGCEHTDKDGDLATEGRLLVVVRSHIYEVDTGVGCFRAANEYNAIGSAAPEANAAMFTLRNIGCGDGKSLVLAALEAAAAFDVYIRPPFSIMCNSTGEHLHDYQCSTATSAS